MPVSKDCPFSEGLYDPDSRVLVLMSADRKQTFHMVPKLDDNGDPMRAKAKRHNGKEYREERKTLETYSEHYISEKEEIEEAIKDHAINASSFNYSKYMETKKAPAVKKAELEPAK